MYLTEGQIVYHEYRGRCVVIVPNYDGANDPLVCALDRDDAFGDDRLFTAYKMLLSTTPPQPIKSQPLVITGQGSFKSTIEEGDI